MLIIYTPALKNHYKGIKCRSYTQFYATAKCFKSTLYHLLHPTEKLLFGSLLYVENNRNFLILLRWSTDCHVAFTRPQPCSISHSSPLNCLQYVCYEKLLKEHGGEALQVKNMWATGALLDNFSSTNVQQLAEQSDECFQKQISFNLSWLICK